MPTSKDYWQDRALRNDARLEREKDLSIRALRKIYDTTQDYAERAIDKFYHKYGLNGVVTLAEARKLLKPAELEEFKKRILQLRNQAKTQQNKEELDQLIGRVRISRETALVAELTYLVTELAGETSDHLGNSLTSMLTTTESHAQFDMEQFTGYQVDYLKLAPSQINAIIHTGWDSIDFSSKIWYDRETLVKNVSRLLPQQFVLGRSTVQLARELRKDMNTSYNNAVRVIRTEGTHVSAQADKNLYKEVGLNEYEFLSTLDTRTSEICQEMDGEIFKLSEAKSGINFPPLHPNCRSTTLPVVDTSDLSELRLARDSKGKNIRVPKMPYKEWKEKQPKLSA
jgi:SPP1 gp7 family putative phage head morphogenesis protein